MKLKTYHIEITETLQMTVAVQARSPEDARAKVRADYFAAEYILDESHLVERDFSIREEPEKPEPIYDQLEK